MLQKKICLLGSFAVGKTSLVRRYVESIYSDVYQTTVGVKVDKKVVTVDTWEMTMVLWDLYGEDEFSRKCDGPTCAGRRVTFWLVTGRAARHWTRRFSLEERVRKEVGEIPFIFVINKCDLVADWQLDDSLESQFAAKNWIVLRSSAKTGENVEEAFSQLARKMLP